MGVGLQGRRSRLGGRGKLNRETAKLSNTGMAKTGSGSRRATHVRHTLLQSDGLYRCLMHDLQHHGFNFFGHTPELRGMKHFDCRRGPDGD